ncbi:MAG TPA: DUF1559 domain-containing protein, partial [Pirellulales bacterium]|nr:DUF1559 domain-containing protein [Pirellulales bacterium]
NNLHQLALAALTFETDTGRFPPGMQQSIYASSPVYRGLSLFVFLLPYLEEKPLADAWTKADPLTNTVGGASARTATVLPLLVCPSDDIPDNPSIQSRWSYALTSYGGNGGSVSYPPQSALNDGIFHTTGPGSTPTANQRAVRRLDVTDGETKTFLFGERSHVDRNYATFSANSWGDPLETWGWWAAAGGQKCIGHVTMGAQAPLNFRFPYVYGQSDPEGTINQQFQALADKRITAFGSQHVGGANFAFVGGAVRFVNDDIAPELLKALGTRAGSEPSDLP